MIYRNICSQRISTLYFRFCPNDLVYKIISNGLPKDFSNNDKNKGHPQILLNKGRNRGV